jgi:hypothetical protein
MAADQPQASIAECQSNSGAPTGALHVSILSQPGFQMHADGCGKLVGACILVLKIIDAMLPPPLPTRQPARLYIGNLVRNRAAA